jgi:hypothetical protein
MAQIEQSEHLKKGDQLVTLYRYLLGHDNRPKLTEFQAVLRPGNGYGLYVTGPYDYRRQRGTVKWSFQWAQAQVEGIFVDGSTRISTGSPTLSPDEALVRFTAWVKHELQVNRSALVRATEQVARFEAAWDELPVPVTEATSQEVSR